MARRRNNSVGPLGLAGVGGLWLSVAILPWPSLFGSSDRPSTDDGRQALSVTASEHAAVRAVMQGSLQSVNALLAAVAAGEGYAEAAQHARSAREHQRAQLPAGVPALWGELGHAADTRLQQAGALVSPDRKAAWKAVGGVVDVCTDCHARFRLE
jgi:hypothetical protein